MNYGVKAFDQHGPVRAALLNVLISWQLFEHILTWDYGERTPGLGSEGIATQCDAAIKLK